MNKTVILLLLLALTGCAVHQITPEEQKAKDEAEKQAFLTRTNAVWSPKCEAMGLVRPTEPWVKCVMQLFNTEQQEAMAQAQQEAAQRAYWGRALQNFGNTVYGPAATQARQIPIQEAPIATQPSFTDCYPDGSGGMSCRNR